MSAVPAFAQSEPFEGVSVTAIGGYESGPGGGGDKGAIFGGQIGYDLRSSDIVYGAEVELSGSTADLCIASVRTCISTGRDIYAGARVGVVTGDSMLIYAKGGYTNRSYNFSYTSPRPPVAPESATKDGWRLGLGVEYLLSENLHLKAEYRYSEYGDAPQQHQGVVGLGFRF
jgi:outer membrane immunogenic protein